MRVLKIAIVIMGVFIVAGYAYLGLEVYRRMTGAGAPAESGDERPLPVTATGEVALGLPAGSRIAEMLAVGNRVVFRVALPDGDRLYVLDPRDGAVVAVATTGGPASTGPASTGTATTGTAPAAPPVQ